MWYRRPLALFEKFYLESYITCWDERWFYAVQKFSKKNGQDAAIGIARMAFVDKGKVLSPESFMQQLNIHVSHNMDAEQTGVLRQWVDADRNFEKKLERILEDWKEVKKVA